MTGLLNSDNWYRLVPLRPFAAEHEMSRHVYRGEAWWVLRDPATGDHHRINRMTYELAVAGRRSHARCGQPAVARGAGRRCPHQDELIVAIAQLAEANLLQAERASDLRQLQLRSRLRKRRELLAGLNPLSFKVAIFDPSAWVERLAGPFGPLFTRAGLIGCALLMGLAGLVAIGQFDRLQADIPRAWSGPGFLFLMWIAYPLLKLAHEFAHALTVRRFGGEVHEMGVRLLVLMPVPYVDASSATLFADKRERALVSGAGILAELVIASGAVLLWAMIEPGLLRDLCLAIVVIGTVSTVLFNGNPLLKFDGYHVLCDLFELPNLAPWRAPVLPVLPAATPAGRRGGASTGSPAMSDAGCWAAGLASWSYRLILFVSIAIYVGSLSWAAGLAILALGLWTMLIGPAFKAGDFVLHSPSLNGRRHRALGLYGGTLAILLVLVSVPAPATTVAMGVVWLPDRAQIRTEVPGTVVELLARDNETVRTGQPVIRLTNDELQAGTAGRGHRAVATPGRSTSCASSARRPPSPATRRSTRRRHGCRTPGAGSMRWCCGSMPTAVSCRRARPIGWARGSTRAAPSPTFSDAPATTIRLALPNDTADRVRDQVRGIEVRLADRGDTAFSASIVNDSPGGSEQLPSAALGAAMGRIDTDPTDSSGPCRPRRCSCSMWRSPSCQPTQPAMCAGAIRSSGHPGLALQAHDALRRLLLRHFST
ncbi:MAG: hypothetical protein R3E68_01105 [Burkholderiaceae bacterium]